MICGRNSQRYRKKEILMKDLPVGNGDRVYTENGEYRLVFRGTAGRRHFSAEWASPGIDKAGTIAFSFDGNPGDPPAIIDLASGDNAFSWSTRMAVVEITVTGLPSGGGFRLYCR
jgi:hypothetical protein